MIIIWDNSNSAHAATHYIHRKNCRNFLEI